jgi:hypothetical protein
MPSPRQVAREQRQDRVTLHKIEALSIAQTPEQIFAAELDLFRLLAGRLPQVKRDRVLTEAAADIKRRRTSTFGDLHKLTSHRS